MSESTTYRVSKQFSRALGLDMSGEIALSLAQGVPFEIAGGHTWSDLTPFAQGYVEALLRSVGIERFDALASEALARIIADCEAIQKDYGLPAGDPRHHARGCWFWKNRQVSMWEKEGFPPLTVTLGDDGKVRFQ
jgi:hypothetical protein